MTSLRKYDSSDFWIAVIAAVGVILFDVLPGLLLASILHATTFIVKTACIEIESMGVAKGTHNVLLPMNDTRAQKTKDNVAIIALRQGRIFYATAQEYRDPLWDLVKSNNDIDTLIIDIAPTDALDFTTLKFIKETVEEAHAQGIKELAFFGALDQKLIAQFDDFRKSHDYVEFIDALNPDYIASGLQKTKSAPNGTLFYWIDP